MTASIFYSEFNNTFFPGESGLQLYSKLCPQVFLSSLKEFLAIKACLLDSVTVRQSHLDCFPQKLPGLAQRIMSLQTNWSALPCPGWLPAICTLSLLPSNVSDNVGVPDVGHDVGQTGGLLSGITPSTPPTIQHDLHIFTWWFLAWFTLPRAPSSFYPYYLRCDGNS